MVATGATDGDRQARLALFHVGRHGEVEELLEQVQEPRGGWLGEDIELSSDDVGGSATGNAGCTYTSSVAADPTNPDTNGNSLTDGTRGELVYSPAWQSRNSVPAYSFTIDLGAAKTITEITAPGSKTSATASCSRRA